ncbi:MAG: hypothetical protein Q4B28_05500 [bacterium]|nr:hypothetical protein [bacterium]
MEQNKSYSSTVILSALSALLFFAPFLSRQMQERREQYSQAEIDFITSRIRVGKTMLYLLCVFFVCYLGALGLKSQQLLTRAYLDASLLFVLMIGATILIIQGIGWIPAPLQLAAHQRSALLKAFIPYGSTIQRFQLQNYQKPNRWLKEAQLWRLVLLMVALFSPVWQLAVVLLFIWSWRVVRLYFAQDEIPQQLKYLLHQSYYKYPEELLILPLKYFKNNQNAESQSRSTSLPKRIVLVLIFLLVIG